MAVTNYRFKLGGGIVSVGFRERLGQNEEPSRLSALVTLLPRKYFTPWYLAGP